MSKHLKGIRSTFVSTKRLRTHVLSSGDSKDAPIVLLHGNLSSGTFFEDLMLSLAGRFRCITPDIRGFGETEDLPIDATRGLRDPADDLCELLDTMGVESAHLVGWSAGAGIIMQFALDHPERTKSLTLIAPVSPYGFGGTRDILGTRSAEDFSGSGGGTVSSDVVEQMRLADAQSDSPFAARQLIRNFYVVPPLKLAREDAFVESIYQARINDQHYPGDYVTSENWPYVAPGNWGIINAMSPKYFDVSTIVDMQLKPPILWIRGDADIVVSDSSAFDLANYYDEESERGGNGVSPKPQPMIGQTRNVLRRYAENGGTFEEIVVEGVGHSPFLESPAAFVSSFTRFLSNCHNGS
jgi:pimeloyl-ACP methyl ester carboxylesterase